jgi:hypothetical protein
MAQRRKKLPLPPVDLVQAPRAKVATTPLVQLAKHANLSPQELSDFTVAQTEELKQLQILNAKTNITGLSLDKVELDALLAVLDRQDSKQELALAILNRAADTGLQGQALEVFGLKLARMGLHQ